MVSYEKAQSETMTNSEFDGKTHLSGTTSQRGSTTKWPTTMPFYDTDLKKWYKNTGTESVPTSSEIGGEGSAYDIIYPLSTTIGDYTLTPASATATSAADTSGTGTVSTSTAVTGNPRATAGIYYRHGNVFATGHTIIGVAVNGVRFDLSKTGSPTGTGYARCYDSGGTLVATFGSIDVSTISGSKTTYTFNGGGSRTIANGDRIVFESNNGDDSNYISVYGTTTDTVANCQVDNYNGSWSVVTGSDVYMVYEYGTAYTAAKTYDGSTSTFWKSTNETNPAIYWDFTSNRKFISFALNLNTTDTTVSTIELSLSTDTTFSGEVKRTLLVSDFTNNTWRYILINIQATDTRYVQLKGSGTGVLSVYEFKARATTDTSPGFGHHHRVISTTSTSASSNDSN